MSESRDGNGAGNGQERVTLPLEALTDELTLTFNRATGAMSIVGHVVNDEVALMMLARAANVYESRTRMQLAMGVKQQLEEQRRVQDLLAQTRGGRG